MAAIINWYGVADVPDVIDDGPHKANLAVQWFGSLPNRDELARRLSPLTYIRADQPPVLTIHGDADPTVNYQQAVRLQEALTKAGVQNQLLTIPGGHHGNFSPDERTKIYVGDQGVFEEEQSAYRAATVRERFLFPAALGSIRQAGSHRFDLVNFAAADLENFAGLHIRRAAVHLHRIHTGHAFDLDLMHCAAMLEHRKRIDQPLLFISRVMKLKFPVAMLDSLKIGIGCVDHVFARRALPSRDIGQECLARRHQVLHPI